jgi:hypothetical protein
MTIITLPKEGNEEYFGLFEKTNELIEAINEIGAAIQTSDLPKNKTILSNRALQKLAPQIIKLERDVCDWSNKAWDFRMNPKYSLPNNDPTPSITATHYTNMLASHIDRMNFESYRLEWNFTLLVSNMMYIDSNKKWLLSFWTGIVLAIIGIILALAGII